MAIDVERIKIDLGVPYREAWNRQDIDAILASHTEDSVMSLHAGGTKRWAGKAEIRAALEEMFRTGPTLHFRDGEEVIAASDALVIQGRAALSRDPTAPSVSAVDVIRLTDDLLISSKDTTIDIAGLFPG